MKKKLLIFIAIVLTVGFLGYTSMVGAQADNPIDITWELNSKDIEKISLIGAEQDVKVEILETEKEKTSITLSGMVSQKGKEQLEETVQKENSLEIKLSEINKLRFMISSEDKDRLTLVLALGKDILLNELNINSVIGTVYIIVPKSFDGKYTLNTNDEGEILEMPETNKTTDTEIIVDTLGDIGVTK